MIRPPNFSLEPRPFLFAVAAGGSLLPGFVGAHSLAAAAQLRVCLSSERSERT
jgi:hypothetical protein